MNREKYHQRIIRKIKFKSSNKFRIRYVRLCKYSSYEDLSLFWGNNKKFTFTNYRIDQKELVFINIRVEM